MIKTKTLPSIRISSKTDSLMKSALNKLNETSIIEITLQDLRRICYELGSKQIISGDQIKLDKE